MNVPSIISRQIPVCILLCTVVLTSGCATIYRHMKQKMEDSYSEGIELYRKGKYREAEDRFETAISIDPEHRKARRYLLITREAMKQRAEKYYEKGIYYKNRKDFVNALDNFLVARKKDPGYKDVSEQIRSLRATDQVRNEFNKMYTSAWKLHTQKKYKASYYYCEKAEKYDPDSIELTTLKLRVALALDQKSSKTTEKAEDHYDKKRYTRALRLATRALKINPWDDKAKEVKKNATKKIRLSRMYSQAEKYYKRRSYFTAYKIFRKVERQEPGFLDTGNYLNIIKSRLEKNINSYYRKGISYYENNQFKQAIDQWNKVLLINPEHKKAREYKERALAKLEIQRSLSAN